VSSPRARRSDDSILRGIEEVVRTHLDRDLRLRPEDRLVETVELDSLRRLTLVIELENHFRLCLEEGDESTIETVADLVAVIRKRS
jgi:acyl carrier protein